MSTAETTTFSPDDLLKLPDGKRFELVNGQLVEKAMGWDASYIAARLHAFIFVFLSDNPVGRPTVEGSYQCFDDDPNRVRRPDVSFVSHERMPGPRPEGHCRIAPDLAVEVVSPGNTYSEIEAKVHEYLDAGVRLVWLVNPPTRSVHVYRQGDSSVTLLRASDQLTGEDVLPGFECSVAALFE